METGNSFGKACRAPHNRLRNLFFPSSRPPTGREPTTTFLHEIPHSRFFGFAADAVDWSAGGRGGEVVQA
jgi:hypothetical protein